MRHLLFNTERLADEIMSRVIGVVSDPITDPPGLTRAIFGVEAETIPELLECEEFDLVCKAVDFLVVENRIFFDVETGELRLLTALEEGD